MKKKCYNKQVLILEVIPLKKKLEVEKKEKKSKTAKKESTIVTKESICATCALFFFLGFLIL